MGSINIGNQLISYNFKEEIASKGFNKLNYKIFPKGVYYGGSFNKIDDNSIHISPTILLFEDVNNLVSIKIETLDVATVEVNNSNVFVIGRFSWVDTENNFMDFLAVDEISILESDIVFGRVQYNGLVLTTNFDYSRKTIANNIYYDFLTSNPPFRVIPTFPYSNNVRVLSSNGSYIHNGKKIEITNSVLSPSFSFPVSLNGRRDVVGISSDTNTIAIIQGNDDSEKSIPNIPYNVLPIAIVTFPPSTISTVRGTYIEYIHPFQYKSSLLTDDDIFNLIKPLFTETDGLDGDSIDGIDGNIIVESLREISNITGISIPLNQGFPYDPFVVPPNMVVLYSSDNIPDGGLMCNGTFGTPNLLDKYLYSSENFGVLGGAFTHDASSHGSAPEHNGNSTTPGSWSVQTTSNGAWSYAKSAHFHMTPAHSHTGLVNHEPLFTHLIPVMGLNHIYKNAVLLSINNLFIPSISKWKEQLNKYIKMAAYIASGGSATHNHDDNSLISSFSNAPLNTLGNSTTSGSVPNMSNHRHYLYHRHTSNNNPTYKNVVPYKVIGDRINTDLQSGTIGLFTTDDIPSGWQKISYSALLRLAENSSTGGSNTHNIIETPTSLDSSWLSATQSLSWATYSATAGSEKPTTISHSHGISSHVHSEFTESMPPYVGLILAIKQ